MSIKNHYPHDFALLFDFQVNEASEHIIYQRLAKLVKNHHNHAALNRIAADELRHYHVYKDYTHHEVAPSRLKVWWHLLLARIFGVTFSIKLMENGERNAQKDYKQLIGLVPEIEKIIADEHGHERELVKLVSEEKLRYIGSIVLGMNDALVELTGTLAGLTFALQSGKLVGVAGLITGVAAALSMAASEYFSIKVEGQLNPFTAAFYTGLTYTVVVSCLVLPFLLLGNPFAALGLTLATAIVLIAGFNYYYSVVRDVPFRRRFLEMLGVSLGVAFLSFVIGLLIRQFLGLGV